MAVCGCLRLRLMSRMASQRTTRWLGRGCAASLTRKMKPGSRPTGRQTALAKGQRSTNLIREQTSNTTPNETLCSGAREIVIEPSGQNPAFCPDENVKTNQRVCLFEALGLGEEVLRGLHGMGVTRPTVIQMATIPHLIQRRHVLCAAQTGSGKTLSYLAPIVHHLREEEVRHGFVARVKRPRACVVVPARELAAQVLEVAKYLSHHARFRSIGLIGGQRRKWITNSLQSPVDVVVATPGTLLKYREKGQLFFSDLTHLVLDEADTLFDDSFGPLTMELLERIHVREVRPPAPTAVPVDTQVTIVGATFPKESVVSKLRNLLPGLTTCTSGVHRVLPHVKHKFVKLLQHEKADELLRLLKENSHLAGKRTIVFCNTAACCDWLGHHLNQQEVRFVRLHGNIPPKQRSDLFKQFQRGQAHTLICTDIVSRGLDTCDVSQVINFDFPTNLVDYIYRVGRTGRVLGASYPTGQSEVTSFMTHNRDVLMARMIQDAARRNRALDVALQAVRSDDSKVLVGKCRK